MPPNLSELTQIIFDTGLTHLYSEASILYYQMNNMIQSLIRGKYLKAVFEKSASYIVENNENELYYGYLFLTFKTVYINWFVLVLNY